MTTDEVHQLLQDIQDMYATARYSETAPDTWIAHLAPFPEALVRQVFWRVSEKDPRYPPSLRELVKEIQATLAPETTTVDDAWGRVMKAGIRCSATDTTCAKQFIDNDAIWMAVQQVGGWYRVATTDYKDYSALIAQFKAAYDVSYRSGQRTQYRPDAISMALPATKWGDPVPDSLAIEADDLVDFDPEVDE